MFGWNETSLFNVFTGAALKSTAVLGVAWSLAFVMRRRSAAARHLVWTAAFAAVLAIPFLSISLPALHVPEVSELLPSATIAIFQTTASASRVTGLPSATSHDGASASLRPSPWHPDWRMWLLLIWALGAGSALAQMLVASAAVWRIRRAAKPFTDRDLCGELSRALGIRQPVNVLATEPGSMPMTFGVLRSSILLPSEAPGWTEERRRVVLLHELAHVRRGDVATHLLARTALMVYWWNPLAWGAWREFLKERERAADDLVLNAGTRASEYASHLLAVARSMQCAPAIRCAAVAMARRSQLESRLVAILDSGVNRTTVGRASALVAALLAVALVIPLAAVKAQDGGVQASETQAIPADVDATIRAANSQKNFEILEKAAAAAERLHKYETAQQLLRAAVAIRAGVSGQQSVDYGLGLLKLADLDHKMHMQKSAEELYTNAAQLLGDRPEASRALMYMGIAAVVNKDFGKAIEYFQRAQRVDPTRTGPALMWMAITRQTEHNTNEADTLFKNALSVQDPKSAEAFTTTKLYAQFLEQQDRGQEASELEERLSALQKASVAQARSQPARAGAYRLGSSGVAPPTVLSKIEPEYSDEARAAKLQGTEVVSVEIGVDGLAHNAVVVQGLGLGLDENGVDAISRWQFQPGRKDGQPVPVMATIEINWRLM